MVVKLLTSGVKAGELGKMFSWARGGQCSYNWAHNLRGVGLWEGDCSFVSNNYDIRGIIADISHVHVGKNQGLGSQC